MRNRMLLRSIAFGALTKLGGSLIVFAGLPIIAHALSGADYAVFLHAVSAASFVTLLLSAVVAITVRTLAQAAASGAPRALAAAERDAAGLFLIAMAASATATMLVVLLGQPARPAVLLVTIALSGVSGLLMWAEAYRIALRTDHVTSMWQLAATLAMLAMLVAFGGRGAMAAILVYLGVPVLGQFAALVQLRRERRLHLRPTFHAATLRDRLREAAPIVGGSLADYVKIFVSGLILARFASAADYARYTTLVLLVARLANPLSLITRPLMPAYIDALHHRDARWLRLAGIAIAAVAALGLVAAIGIGLLMPPGWLRWALPAKLGAVTRGEILFPALFLWGIGMGSLMMPLYVARRRAGLVSMVNAAMAAAGVGAGALLAARGIAGGMLIAMATTSAATGLFATVHALRHLLKLDEPLPIAEEAALLADPPVA